MEALPGIILATGTVYLTLAFFRGHCHQKKTAGTKELERPAGLKSIKENGDWRGP